MGIKNRILNSAMFVLICSLLVACAPHNATSAAQTTAPPSVDQTSHTDPNSSGNTDLTGHSGSSGGVNISGSSNAVTYQYTTIYRYYSTSEVDHMYFTYEDAISGDYVEQGYPIEIFAQSYAGTVPLWACSYADPNTGGTHHFLKAMDLPCNGSATGYKIGYIMQSPAAGLVPVYELNHEGDQVATINPSESSLNNPVFSGILGYVPIQ